jgi:hypothetical protein
MSERIHLTAKELCDVSGLTLEAWGIDATTRVCVSEDFVNGCTADGVDLPDLCGGNAGLQRLVWRTASARWGTPSCDGLTREDIDRLADEQTD